ncbi:peptidoglycan-binding protein [Streptomyces sp900105755]|uniref:peptidoglycan-binding protein n=1 Tax=unclassified Streptomyces TaxID=2593676 RepID=UPI00089C8909|nr:peptidoglycan-binding protein [Streptomyces sp. Ag109_O5-10]SEF16533.1 Putative peptidoglycan binding domain-containing protein [Streptomyces sp. Ag109_O5-10]
MSTPPDPEQPHRGPVLEPVRVLRPRRLDTLAELMREFHADAEAAERTRATRDARDAKEGKAAGNGGPADFEAFEPAAGSGTGAGSFGSGTEDETQELPPVTDGPRTAPGSGGYGHGADPSRAFGFGPGLRRAAVVVAVGAAALVGFGCALLLPGREGTAEAAQPSGSASTAPVSTPPASDTSTDPDGAGTLRQGDTGPGVVELEQRLLRIPDVYRDGSTGGTYDAALTAAVERFQVWYGISGDERGVYGDDTRRALESRTGLSGG